MQIFTQIEEVRRFRNLPEQAEKSLGFVPTMGALHEGHLALVRCAKSENKRVAISIFVNPIQFNNPEDLRLYPRTLERDLEMLGSVLEDDDFVFAPEAEEMYPDSRHQLYDFGTLEKSMEGLHRPGHFNGVGVVVDRLFRIVEPDRAYFGEKDYQQLAIIRRLVEIEKHGVTIVPCPIIRENDGLAMSSRNVRLSIENRRNAPRLYSLLQETRQRIQEGADLRPVQQQLTHSIDRIPGFKTDYVCFADEATLEPLNFATNRPFRCFIAVNAGDVRLIDNLPMY